MTMIQQLLVEQGLPLWFVCPTHVVSWMEYDTFTTGEMFALSLDEALHLKTSLEGIILNAIIKVDDIH